MVNSFFQALFWVWTSNSIADKHNKLSKLKFYVLIGLIFLQIVFFTYGTPNYALSNVLLILVTWMFLVIFFRKSILDALLGFGFSYSLISIEAQVLLLLNSKFISKLNLKLSPDIQMVLFIYVPVFIIYLIVYYYRKKIFNFLIFLKSLKNVILLVLAIDYSVLIFNTLNMELLFGTMTLAFKSVFYSLSVVAFAIVAIYFARISNDNKEVEMLNAALNDKINELKKVKHDYGSEISSLYGLYQLGRVGEIGELLKSIVEKNQSLNTSIEVNIKASPIVTSIFGGAAEKGVNVICFDTCDYDRLDITLNDILKLLSNIVNNSVEAIATIENPIIKFKSYNSYSGAVITITNNGPEIPKEIIKKIFTTGFSTKDNIENDHGYGLGIVKDIIKKTGGTISVESNKDATQFNIEIPFKSFKT